VRFLCSVSIAFLLATGTADAQLPHVQALAAKHLGADQGVFVQARDGTVLVAQRESRAVHPASVTKVATTLALLDRLGPEHRFETHVIAGGPVRGDRIEGDLLIEAHGDPAFVFENAFLVLRDLHRRGLRKVRGDLQLRGDWSFNWRSDDHGRRLKRALQGLDGANAWDAIGEPRARLRAMGLDFAAKPVAPPSGQTLLVHHSPTLRAIVKALNGYSNNVFHPLSNRIGGPGVVESLMRARIPASWRSEVIITNAAGAGESNRMSPRAAVAILWELGKELREHELRFPDVLPVNGLDAGTLGDRLNDEPYRARVAGKTGTYGSVGASALAGVLRTPEHGEVAFAVLNSWVPVPEARQRQDAFVRALIETLAAQPWDHVTNDEPLFRRARIE